MENGFELVHTVLNYYDGEVSGVADYKGTPHFFERQFDSVEQEYSDKFLLTALTDDQFQKSIESYEIFLRWKAAFDSGKTDLATHPALPSERARWQELQKVLESALKTDPARALSVKGEMMMNGGGRLFAGIGQSKVRWWVSKSD